VPVTIKDNRAAFLRNYDEAREKATVAAGNHLLAALKKAFGSDYYKGGAFRSTLGVRQSLSRTRAALGPDGYSVRVGSRYGAIKAPKGVKTGKFSMVPLFWELGHYNRFTRRFERREIFKPTALNQLNAIRAEFAKTFKRYADRPV